MKVLYQGIQTLFSTDNTLNTAVGGRLRPHEALESDSFPYVVYSLISHVFDPYFGDSKNIERFRVQFSIYSEKSSSTEVLNIFEYLKSLYDGCSLTVTGYTFLKCVRENSVFYRRPDLNVWEHHTDYIIEVSTV